VDALVQKVKKEEEEVDWAGRADGLSEMVSGTITAANSDNADDRTKAVADLITGTGHTCLAVAIATAGGAAMPAAGCCAAFAVDP